MKIILIHDTAQIAKAAAMAYRTHRTLLGRYPWLPEKREDDFVHRIEWMAREGRVYGLAEGDELLAFLGWFKIDDYRNVGAAAFTPDWCSAVSAPDGEVPRLMGTLVRRLLGDLKEAGIPIHALGIASANGAFLEEFSLLGYGRIVLDAARPTAELIGETGAGAGVPREPGPGELNVRAATGSDAKALSELDASLARHVGAPPVLMPDTHGSTEGEWEQWLASADSLTFVAERDGIPVGFIKADPPHFDVSWFVHGAETMAICGLYVDPASRGSGAGEALLRRLALTAADRGYTLMSVDCETHNPEARAFWTRRFRPVTWSFERRL